MPRSSLWRHRDFMRLWAAETVSQFGTAVTLLALPLVAINHLHATAFQVGALSAVEFAPFILVGLPAGVWVDRLRRKPILLTGDLGRALVLASIPIAYELDALTIGHLYVAAFLTGVLTVFFDVAYQSYLPSLVERPQLADGNAKLEITRSAAQIAGPGLGGVLIGVLTAPVAIAADAVSFVLSAGALTLIRKREAPPERALRHVRPRMRTEIAEGLRYVLGHRLLRPIAMCTATSNLFSSIGGPVLVLFMVRRLEFSPGTIGLVFAIGNVGFLIGASACGWMNRRIGLGRSIVLSMAFAAPFMFLNPLATSGAPVALVSIAGVAFALSGAIYNISQVSLRQAICPDRFQGRMNASMRFMVWGTLPIGAALGGFLGGTIGLRPTLFVSAAGQCLAWIPPAFSPVWRLRSIAQAEEEEATRLAEAHDGVVGPSAPASGVVPGGAADFDDIDTDSPPA
jgi:MFS family permease